MNRYVLALCLCLSGHAAAQTDPDLWSFCIASPDPACIVGVALAEADGNGSGESNDYQLDALAHLMLEHGQTALAREAALRVASPDAALNILTDLIPVSPTRDIAGPAVALALAQPNAFALDLAMSRIALGFVAANDIDVAQGFLGGLQDPLQQGRLASAIAGTLAGEGEIAAAEALIAGITDLGWAQSAQVAVAVGQVRSGQVQPALDRVATLGGFYRLSGQLGLLPHVPADTQAALADEIAAGLNEDFDPLPGARDTGDTLATLPLDRANTLAPQISGALTDPAAQATLLLPVLAANRLVLAATGDDRLLQRALSATAAIQDPIFRGAMQLDLAPYVTDTAVIAAWAAAFEAEPSEHERAYLLATLASARGDADLAALAAPYLAMFPDDYDLGELRESMVQRVAFGPTPARITEFRPLLDNISVWADVVEGAVAGLVLGGEAALAEALARELSYDHKTAIALGRIGALTGNSALLSEALQLARDGSDAYRLGVLVALAEAMLTAPD